MRVELVPTEGKLYLCANNAKDAEQLEAIRLYLDAHNPGQVAGSGRVAGKPLSSLTINLKSP